MIQRIKELVLHKQFLNFINYYIFTIINAGVSIIAISYLTKHIPPEDYGKIGIFSSILFFVPSLITLSTNGLQSIEIVNMNKEDYLKFRNHYISFVIQLSFICTIIFLLLSPFFRDYFFVVITAIILGFIQVLSAIHNTELFQYSKPTLFGVLSTFNALLGFFLTFIFITLFDLDWKSRIVALIITEFIILILRFFIFSDIGAKYKFENNLKQTKIFLMYGSPLILASFAGWIINQSDRYFILNYFDLKEVGNYAVAAAIASFISMINTNMIKVVYPIIFKKLSERKGKKLITKIILLYSILIIFFATLFCLGIYFFGDLFLGNKYHKAYPIVYLMCFGQALFGIYTINTIAIDYFKLTQLKTLLIALCAIVIIIFSFVLIHYLESYGPAVASLISFTVLMVISFIITRRLFKTHNISS